MTWPLIVTRHLENGDDNLGLYRMQVFSDSETGMHWQIGKGGGLHHHHAVAVRGRGVFPRRARRPLFERACARC